MLYPDLLQDAQKGEAQAILNVRTRNIIVPENPRHIIMVISDWVILARAERLGEVADRSDPSRLTMALQLSMLPDWQPDPLWAVSREDLSTAAKELVITYLQDEVFNDQEIRDEE